MDHRWVAISILIVLTLGASSIAAYFYGRTLLLGSELQQVSTRVVGGSPDGQSLSITISTANGASVCPGALGGAWSSGNCELPRGQAIIIPQGTTLTIGSSVVLATSGADVDNSGTIVINASGTMFFVSGNFINYKGGTVEIERGGALTNGGELVNLRGGIINNGGTLANEGTIYNYGTINSTFDNNNGTFVNFGSFGQ